MDYLSHDWSTQAANRVRDEAALNGRQAGRHRGKDWTCFGKVESSLL